MIEVWLFRLLVLGAVVVRIQKAIAALVVRAKNNLRLDELPSRLRRVLFEVVFQSKTIVAKPVVGTAHGLVFWGFVAFGGYTTVEFLAGLGIADWTEAGWFHAYERLLVPFAWAVLAGITALSVRRGLFRPAVLSLSGRVSKESLLIGLLIAALMGTFLLSLRLEGTAARINWWLHAFVILSFLVLIPNSKHLHLLVSPLTLLLKSNRLGTVPNLDFEKEEVGFETVKDLEAKEVIDAFTCVECGRCQERCPAFATGKALNPKKLILQNEEALLAGRLDQKLVDLYDPEVLWQCTTVVPRAALPGGIEHFPSHWRQARPTSNGRRRHKWGGIQHLERRAHIWGLDSTQLTSSLPPRS